MKLRFLQRKLVPSILVFAMLFTGVLPLPVAQAFSFSQRAEAAVLEAEPVNDTNTVYDLVAIVIASDLDDSTYIGLRNEGYPGLNESTLEGRVLRYAEDISSNYELTDTTILFFDKEEDSVMDLASALENLYQNGDGDNNNRLAGVLLVGDIPLPVVNKDGNRFISLFPYTDFEDKTYVYNSESLSYERNYDSNFPKPEIWHGIMRAPSNDIEGNETLATFFDKNHLYYQGHDEFAKFDRKLFFGDLVHEEEKINPEVYSYYLEYLDNLEDLAYKRYNKYWAQELVGNIGSEIPAGSINPDAEEFLNSFEGESPMATVPDLFTKTAIDQALISYYEVFSKYVAQANDWAENTGRYAPDDVDNVAVLITIKDEFSKEYLKEVNTALEKKIMEVVDMVDEPLPILSSTTISGKFEGENADTNFIVNLGLGDSYPLRFLTQTVYRFHYFNEVSQKLYVNGVDVDLLESPKQCSVFLGSTDSSYFDENLEYNPKAVDGEYSILTRSLRTDNLATSIPEHTTGINTRLLSPTEAHELTGVSVAGAYIESDPEHGIPAFAPNHLTVNYRNPLEGMFQEGDLIVRVNNRTIDHRLSFDQAIENSYRTVREFITAVNNNDLENLPDVDYISYLNAPLTAGDIVSAKANIGVEFYRDGALMKRNFTFTLNRSGYTSAGGSLGSEILTNAPRVFILLSDMGYEAGTFDPDNFNYASASNAGIFTINDTRKSGAERGGYSNKGYDSYAGCSQNSAGINSDRCFPMLASMPVMDPAGSVAPIKMEFPENYPPENEAEHMDIFQYPEGYNYEEIDDVYFNSCYAGLPSIGTLASDSNPHAYPLDPEGLGIDIPMVAEGEGNHVGIDLYGRHLEAVGDFIKNLIPSGSDPEVSPSKSTVWLNLDQYDASNVILNNNGGDFVTLKEFSDRYGLFDGIDNDGDGIRDYEWREDVKWYDFDEADIQYGIPSGNMDEIARKLLSHPSSYTVPHQLTDFDRSITLNVNPSSYQGKEISSLVYHNEPSDYTIAEQLKSMSTFSLPIDSPRYLAFQAQPEPPVDPGSHYYPGSTEKIIFPNTFRVENLAQLEADLDALAWRIAFLPGAEKIPSPSVAVGDYEAIHDEIIEEYFSVVIRSEVDSPISGFDLEVASTLKLNDSLDWLNMNIDDKHEYVLRKYLNPDPRENAYVADSTMFPAAAGANLEYGYEAAYLVLDGGEDYFDMNFNKDLPEETDERFDPLSISMREAEARNAEGEGAEGAGGSAGAGAGAGASSEEFVPLTQFLGEVQDFVDEISAIPAFFSSWGGDYEFEQSCGASRIFDSAVYGEETAVISSLPADQINLSVSKSSLSADGVDTVRVEVQALDENGNQVGHGSDMEQITLMIEQDEDNPVLEFSDTNQKTLVNGSTSFTLNSTNNAGDVNIYVVNPNGLASNRVGVSSTNRRMDVLSYTLYESSLDARAFEEIEILVPDEELDGVVDEGEAAAGDFGAGLDELEELAGAAAVGAAGDEGDEIESVPGAVDESADFDLETGDTQSETDLGDRDPSHFSGVDGDEAGDLVEDAGADGAEDGEIADGVVEGARPDGTGPDAVTTVDEDGNIIVLLSELVDEEGAIGEDSVKVPRAVVEEEVVEEGEVVVEEVVVEDDVRLEDLLIPDKWIEYYNWKEYHKNYLDFGLESFRSRPFVQLYSDNMIAFLGEEVNPFIDGEIEPNSEMVADGESLMMIEVQLFDDNNKLDKSKRYQVEFSILGDVPDIVEIVSPGIVESANGVAIAYLKAGTVSGDFVLRARVLGEPYPVVDKELRLVAGEPAQIDIETDTNVLLANDQSKAHLRLLIKDRFGNIANNSFSQISLFTADAAHFDPRYDENSDLIGTQIGTFAGVANIELIAEDEVMDELDLFAVFMDYELETLLSEVENDTSEVDFSNYIVAREKFEIIDSLDLSINVQAPDESGAIRVAAELLHNGQRVEKYSGDIVFENMSTNLGSFLEGSRKMSEGRLAAANTVFVPNNIAGTAEIFVELPGFLSDNFQIEIEPDEAYRIELKASEDVIFSNGGELVLEARVLDKYGNLLSSDNSTIVSFEPSAATAGFVEFTGAKTARALNGVASTTLKGAGMSGELNLVASAEGLMEDSISLLIKKRLGSDSVAEFSPRALYISLLGAPGLAETLLHSGNSQAVSGLTASSEGNRLLLGVDGFGKVDLLSETMDMQVIQANDSFPYQKLLFADSVASMFMVPNTNTDLRLIEEGESIPEEDGIYVERLSYTDTAISFSEEADGVYVKSEDEIIIKVDRFGRITINDASLEMKVPEEDEDTVSSDVLSFLIYDRGEALALISFNQKFESDVIVLPAGSEPASLFPGIYVQLNSYAENFEFEPAFTRASSSEPMGVYLTDTNAELDISHSPGFEADAGYGFEGNNKHMLFFAAGNSVGESSLPYGSEVGIVYGDPMIRLRVEGIVGLVSGLTGYSKDIGKPIFSGEKEIQDMIEFDYNGDGSDDLLLTYEDGYVRLLENEISNKRFRDKGYILKLVNGIFSATKIDWNNDGYDDLIIGTRESCNVGETCISQFTNLGGSFEMETLDLAIKGKAYEMKSGDMNADGCEDLVLSDSAGNLRVFYNEIEGDSCIGLSTNHGNSWNFGFQLDSGIDIGDTLFVNYPGMQISDDSGNFIQLSIPSNAEAPSAVSDFVYLRADARLLSSTKSSTDMNGESVALGDTVDYRISLKNNSGVSINNLMLSDVTPLSMTLQLDSLKCLDNGCTDELQWIETGMSGRSHVIKGISVPAGGERNIVYSVSIDEMPKVNFDISNDFTEYPQSPSGQSYNGDLYLDILVKPQINPNAELIYEYSTGLDQRTGYVKYNEHRLSSEPSLDELMEEAGQPDYSEFSEEDLQELMAAQNVDADYDGAVDSWDNTENSYHDAADAVAAKVKGISNMLRCSGAGCLPIPYNQAFFVPDGPIPGTAVVAVGTPNPPYVAFGYPSSAPSSARWYVSPTLTGGLGTAICVGPSTGHQSPCYVAAAPQSVRKSVGLCPDILGPVNDAIAKAKNSLADPDVGMSTIVSDGENSAGTDAINTSGRYSDPDSPLSYSGAVNVRVPGFPSVITDWLDNQTDEIFNKLLDLPDFYFIYPDVNSLISDHAVAVKNFDKNRGGFQSAHDFLRAANSLPMLQIEGKEVLIRVPAISQAEVEKWKRQAELWIQYEEEQIRKIEEFWTCDISEDRRTICDSIQLNMQDLILSVRRAMDKLDQIANLPRDILTWRNMEAKYATQLICYMDTVMNYTGGYIKRQEKIIESWMRAVEDIIRTVRDWRLLLDMILEYQVSCDQCMNDRFSDLGLLLSFFAAIPDPPIIPMPKWPDVVFDISQIQTGVRIVWPDLTFKPEQIRLPDLPTITLPEIAPNIVFEVPGFDVPDWLDFPSFVLPDLPDLPPLPLPQLPDLPRPPKIPQLPNLIAELMANLKPIFTILCLLKKGLIPVPEWGLATEIETLTQPSVQIVLPIIRNLGVQMPGIQYDYVEQINITAKLNMGINTDYLYLVVKRGADKFNEKVKNFVRDVNSYTELPWQAVLDNAIEAAVGGAVESAAEVIEGSAETVEELSYFEEYYDGFDSAINDYIAEMEQFEYPDTYYLTATQIYLDPEDPMLNRSLAQVEADILTRDLPDTPEMQEMIALRDSLIAYTKGLNESNALLQDIDDYNDFNKILVDNDKSIRQIAALSTSGLFETTVTEEVEDSSLLGEDVEEKIYLAANIDYSAEDFVENSDQSSPTQLPVGFFVAAGNSTENVLNYTSELTKTTHTIFSDVDSDEDFDIVYSMGGDVYLKENHSNKVNYPKGSVYTAAVSDYATEGPSTVQAVRSIAENHKKVDIAWAGVEGAVAYEVFINEETSYVVESSVNPSISINIDNGNYYPVIYAIDADGNRSLPSYSTVVAPQSCGDTDAPFPAVSQNAYEIPLFTELEIDASNSFDSSGEIVAYYLETLPYEQGDLRVTELRRYFYSDINYLVDEDGDGIAVNDRSNPRFRIGPFEYEGDIGEHKFILHVVDQSGNSSAQEITVKVSAPDITLDESIAWTSVATGETLPGMPVTLMRKRTVFRVYENSLKAVLKTEKVDRTVSDQSGRYEITGLNLEDMILVENSAGEVIAEVNPDTGNLERLLPGYFVVSHEASPPETVTRTEIVDSEGNVYATVYVVADQNVDVRVTEEFDESAGVQVIDEDPDDGYRFVRVPADDLSNPGAVVLQGFFIVDTAGNVLVLDPRASIERKENDHLSDPLIYELSVDGEIVAEVYASVAQYMRKVKVVGPNDLPFTEARPPIENIIEDEFIDVDDELAAILTDLKEKGIIEGRQTAAGVVFNPQELVNRAEFVKTLLAMLCIEPSAESYESGIGFNDIPYSANNLIWYYPYVKEASTLGLVHGYRGELDAGGLVPFKPENTITRAEAVKIILEALEFRGVLDLEGLEVGDPWYDPFVEAGQNLTPYMTENANVLNNFIISAEEAANPEQEMTREDLIVMTMRVLETYNCFEKDEDGDGVFDVCEAKYGFENPNGDEDNDQLSNALECSYGLDPTDQDTDGGGVNDGVEINAGTDPLNPNDDSIATEDYQEGESGIYIVPAACSTCPCVSAINHAADLIPGDIFFSVISTDDEKYWFSKSNEVNIQTVNK